MKPRRGPGPSRTSVALQSLVNAEPAPGEGEAVVLSTLQDLVARFRLSSDTQAPAPMLSRAA